MTATTKPATRPASPHFSSGPCAKRPGWTPQTLDNAFLGRSHRAKDGKARLKLAIDKTKALLGLPAGYHLRHRARLRHRRLRDGHVDDARRPRRRRAGLGELRQGLGDRRHQAAQAQGRARHGGRVRRAARPRARSISRATCCSPGQRHHVGRARAELRLDPGRPRRPDVRRRDLRRLRPADRLDQGRCADLLVAEGAGRRGRARHAGAVAARRRAAGELHAGLAAAEDVPPDQGRQVHEGACSRARPSTRRRCCAWRIISTRSPGPRAIGGLPALRRARRCQRARCCSTGSSARRGSPTSPSIPRRGRTPASA